MKILQVHNRYQSGESGEDVALEADRALLTENGHEVIQFFGSNVEFATARGLRRVALGANAIWSRGSFAALQQHVRRNRPDIVHVHNTFAQLSASIYWALAQEGIPVVQTVQNYRWTCPTSTLFRDGHPCEECVGRMPLPAVIHGCSYNDSLAAGLVIAGSNATHLVLRTLKRKVHAVIALTEFMKLKLREAGFDEARLHVRANFIPDPGSADVNYASREKHILFVGQIEAIKGVAMCAEAWTLTEAKDWRLSMIGDGKLRQDLVARWSAEDTIDWQGKIARSRAIAAMSSSRFLVLPSLWYEGLPLVLVEAMSHGTPAIVPDHGAFPEIVEDGVNGIVFKAGDLISLRDAFRRAMSMPAHEWTRLAHGARSRFLERYTSQVAYDRLLGVYSRATEIARGVALPSHS